MEIQEAVPVVVDRLPDANHRLNQSSVKRRIKSFLQAAVLHFTVMLQVRTRDEDEGKRPVEPGENETTVSGEEEPVRVVVDQSTATDFRVEESAVRSISDYKSYVIQLTVALAFAGGSFGAMYAVPGGVNKMGSAVVGDTTSFIVFLVTDMLSLLASLMVAMVIATVSEISPKMDYMIRISLWAAGVSFVLSFHVAAYVVVQPKHKWIVLCFGCTITMALALLLLYCLSNVFHKISGIIRMGNEVMGSSDGDLERGHFSRDSRRGQLIRRRIT